MELKIARLLLIFGIIMIASSVSGFYHWGMGSGVNLGKYEGTMFRVSGNFHLIVMSNDGAELNICILTGEDVLRAIKDGSFANVTPLYHVEKSLYFEAVIEIAAPGWYGVLVAPFQNITAHYDIEFEPIVPSSNLFFYGSLLMVAGIVLFVVARATQLVPSLRRTKPESEAQAVSSED